MTQKKIITKVAKIIRKNTHYPYIYSIKIAKLFLQEKYKVETKENIPFIFVWEWCGIEEKNWNGCLYFYDKKNKRIDSSNLKGWKIPLELYLYQKQYKKNKRNY